MNTARERETVARDGSVTSPGGENRASNPPTHKAPMIFPEYLERAVRCLQVAESDLEDFDRTTPPEGASPRDLALRRVLTDILWTLSLLIKTID